MGKAAQAVPLLSPAMTGREQMASTNNKDGIKITLEDLAAVSVPDAAAAAAPAPASGQPGAKNYGSINSAAEQAMPESESHSKLLMQGWFYLGAAGLLGAVIGWGICEPGFVDDIRGHHWGNIWLLPFLVMFMCLGFALAESIVERSLRKALIRGAMALPLGIGLGFIFDIVANIIYNIALGMCASAGVSSFHNPAVWIARGIAWMVFGVAGGAVYGIIGRSGKKAKYGILGGIIGAGLGGLIFDPISFATHGGAPSRAVGFALFGIATGVAMGLVESALKDRWLYVTAGPLAGKQFILYKEQTIIGSQQQSDIYLFKDPNILPQHAVLEMRGSRVQMRAIGQVYVAGQPISERVLHDGDIAQIGRYAFRYKEKQRS
jgi:type III secretion system (T3SS) inner membrane Yop/YscD-like protein